jgi:dihydrofolate reductase
MVMGRLIVSNFVTMDGLYSGPDGDMGALFAHQHPDYVENDAFDDYNVEILEAAGFLLLSHTAFLGSKSYWTGVPNDPTSTAVRRRYSELIAAVPKLVVSDRLSLSELEPWNNTRVLPRSGAPSELAKLKSEYAGDILVILSRLLWQDLLLKGLVDEVQLTTFPLVGGRGTAMFEKQLNVAWRLKSSRRWPNSGNVLSVYEPLVTS